VLTLGSWQSTRKQAADLGIQPKDMFSIWPIQPPTQVYLEMAVKTVHVCMCMRTG